MTGEEYRLTGQETQWFVELSTTGEMSTVILSWYGFHKFIKLQVTSKGYRDFPNTNSLQSSSERPFVHLNKFTHNKPRTLRFNTLPLCNSNATSSIVIMQATALPNVNPMPNPGAGVAGDPGGNPPAVIIPFALSPAEAVLHDDSRVHPL